MRSFQVFEIWKKRLKWVITALFFFGLPTYFLAFGLERICRSHSRDALETQFHELDSILFKIGKHSNALEYFSNLLSSLEKAAGFSNERKEFLEKEIQSINKRFPGTFAFVCVDSNGELLSDISEKGISKVLVRKLYFSLLDSLNETPGVKNKELKKNWGLYLNYVGAEANPDRLEIPMKMPIETNIGEKRHWFFAFVDSRGGIFSHINKTPEMEIFALVDQIRSGSGEIPDGAEMGVYDIQKNESAQNGAVLEAMGEFQRTTRRHFQIGSNIYGILPFSPTLRLWIRVSNSKLARIGTFKNCFLLIILIFFACSSYFLLKKMVLDDPIYFSIKIRLPVLFFFAGGFPAFVLLFCGWDYILQKRQERIHALHEETEGVLRSVEAGFYRLREDLQRSLKKSLGDVKFETPGEQREFFEVFKKSGFLMDNSHVRVFEKTGLQVGEFKGNSFRGEVGGKKIMGTIVFKVLGILNEESLEGKDSSATNAVFQNVGGKGAFFDAARGLGKIVRYSFVDQESWSLFLPLAGETGTFNHMAVVVWRKADLEWLYIKKCLTEVEKRIPDMQLFAINLDNEECIPAKIPIKTELMSNCLSVKLQGMANTVRIKIKENQFLLTGFKPFQPGSIFLFSLRPQKSLFEEFRRLVTILIFLTLLVCGISVLLGYLLSRQVLEPIKFLAEGVRALQKKRFDHRVPEFGEDEFGQLSRLLNRTVESLSDLDLARILQEKLLSSEAIRMENCEIFGKTVFASETGGDYYGVKSVGNKKIAIMIGDVNGHGLPAALVMTMVKALADHSWATVTDPASFLTRMNVTLARALKQRRLVTFFCAVLDIETGVLSYSNAGHCSPFVFRMNSEPLELFIPSNPLGLVKRAPSKTLEVKLLPGDIIFFYSDNLYEARSGEESLGIPKMVEGVGAVLSGNVPQKDAKILENERPIVQMCQKIFEWHGRATSEIREDDMTVLLVQYGSSGKDS